MQRYCKSSIFTYQPLWISLALALSACGGGKSEGGAGPENISSTAAASFSPDSASETSAGLSTEANLVALTASAQAIPSQSISTIAMAEQSAENQLPDATALSVSRAANNVESAPAAAVTLDPSSLAITRKSRPIVIPGAPKVNLARIPLGSIGVSYDNVRATTDVAQLSSDGTGDFRTICDFSHMNFDDPIVYPGQPGTSHLHAFFGNTGANANSTAASLATTGNSTCRGGTINRTAYWQPSIIDTKDGSPVTPRIAIVYYKSAGALPADIQPMPLGLRMIAGDPKASAPVQWGTSNFNCSGTAVGSDHNWPPTAADPGPHSIPNCAVGSEVWASVAFPRCWDGVNLDSPDHKSHMADWPSPNPYADANHPNGQCPPTHPVTLPQITITVVYPVTEANAPLRWRLSSDTYDTKIPAGYSLHADWFDGWRPDIVKTWVTKCINTAKDCQAHMLGDGRMMLGVGVQ